MDDDPIVRAGVRAMVEADPGLAVVGEAPDGVSAEELVARERPDVVLLDLRMPVQDGFVTAQNVSEQPDAPYILVLTTMSDWEDVRRALAAGASGFLFKDTPPAEFVAAIHRARQGLPQFAPQVTRRLVDVATSVGAVPATTVRAETMVARLSPRELSVAIALAEGATNGEIADRLHVSVATVKTHVNLLLDKLDAKNRVQIAVRVCQAGLL